MHEQDSVKDLYVYQSESVDVFYNLALEDHFFRNLEKNQVILFFWKSSPSIVMGRFQNAFKELSHLIAQDREIVIARRQSGGGCVYHDLGNLNFTFIHNKEDYDVHQNMNILIAALKTLDIEAYTTKRFDLRVGDNLKITGSAFKQTKWANYHHGTLLIDADLELLNSSLLAVTKKMQDKAIDSIRSTVVNLKEVNQAITEQKVITAFTQGWESLYQVKAKPIVLSGFDENKFRNWEWVYGENPKFNLEIDFEDHCFKFLIKKGLVETVEYIASSGQGLLTTSFDELVGKRFATTEYFALFDSLLSRVIDEDQIDRASAEFKRQILG